MVNKDFRVVIDLKKPISGQEFEVVNGDTGNRLTATVVDDGAPVVLTGCRVIVLYQHAAGTRMQDSAEADSGVSIGGTDGNEITMELRPACMAPGLIECEVQIYSGENTLITTARYNFGCRQSMLNDDTLAASEEDPLLFRVIQGAKGDKGDKGDTGNVLFPVFSVSPQTGVLSIERPDDCSEYSFSINENGRLEVSL